MGIVLLEHVIGSTQNRLRNRETQRLRGLEIDGELEGGRPTGASAMLTASTTASPISRIAPRAFEAARRRDVSERGRPHRRALLAPHAVNPKQPRALSDPRSALWCSPGT